MVLVVAFRALLICSIQTPDPTMNSRRSLPMLGLLSVAVSFSSVALGQGSNAGVVEVTDSAKNFPGYVVDDVVVPVPSEIFSVLDKLGEPNWRQELRNLKAPDTTDRTRLSLVFGSVVAEGFIAVQAQDKKAVEDIGREVIDLAKSLGIQKAVLPHANAILDASKNNNWPAIRKEFDLTQKTVRETMEKMKDNDLSQCVSVGGWLRGTGAVTAVVGKNFSADRAELLQQPMLVDHFIGQIGKMPQGTQKHATVKAILDGLTVIKNVMTKSTEAFTPEGVSTISKTTAGLLEMIDGKP
jgi:hypothetical protein